MKISDDILIDDFLNLPDLADYQTDFERAIYLRQTLINQSTNDGPASDKHYVLLRKYFLSREDTKDKVPSWVRTNRSLSDFWQFIKHEYGKYEERRQFIRREFNALLDYLELEKTIPNAQSIDETFRVLNSEYIHSTWSRALERKDNV
ncbi:MAG TPA: hypothetical protein P5510_06000 [Clostridia bacterium]|nr:hypothetical protein [Clostridia bacterium]